MTIPTVSEFGNALRMMTLSDLIGYLAVAMAIGAYIIKRLQGKQKNIFTVVFGYVGDLLFTPVSEKIESLHITLNHKLDKVQTQAELNAEELAKFRNEVEKREAKRLRADILCFADACRGGQKYTRKHYENVLNEITDYKALCEEAHVENHVLEAEEEFINQQYRELLTQNKFL